MDAWSHWCPKFRIRRLAKMLMALTFSFFNKLICCICRCHLSLKLTSLARWKTKLLKGRVLDERQIVKIRQECDMFISKRKTSWKSRHHIHGGLILASQKRRSYKKNTNSNVVSFKKSSCQPTSLFYFVPTTFSQTRQSSLGLVLVVVVLVLLHQESSAKCRSSIAS